MTAMLEKTIDDTIVDQPFADDANVDEPPTSAPTLSKVVGGKTVTMTGNGEFHYDENLTSTVRKIITVK